jgi:hypothetical protein
MNRTSELILLLVLLLLVGFARVYYGGEDGLMFVWKGEFGFKDTLVNLPEILALPPDELAREHPSMLSQLEGMGFFGNEDRSSDRWRKYHLKNRVRLVHPKSASNSENSGSSEAPKDAQPKVPTSSSEGMPPE